MPIRDRAEYMRAYRARIAGDQPRRRARPPDQIVPGDRATAYAVAVLAGEIIAGDLVIRACQRHMDDLAAADAKGWVWDAKAAERAINFFPLLRHYKGQWGPHPGKRLGDPVQLQPWQCFIVGCGFGWKMANGRRRFRTLYIEVAAKNGKTLMAAGMALLLGFFDGEAGAEVYSGATKFAQAALSWNDARRMVQGSPLLRKRISVSAGALVHEPSASKFVALGKDSERDQGINVHGAIIDELHVHHDRELMDNIEKATGARAQPLVVKITTAGVRRESVWAEVRKDAVAILEGRAEDDTQFAVVYTLDRDDDIYDEANWPKANPNLGVSVEADFIRSRAAIAQRSPGALAPFLRYHMNMPTQVSTRAISIEEWDANAAEPRFKPGDTVYAGLDLASIQDLTALIILAKHGDNFDIACKFWCPAEGIADRSRIDGVPYEDWVRDGFLIATPGVTTDYAFVRAEIAELAKTYQVHEIGYDPYNATQLATELREDGAPAVAISQTFAMLAPAWRELEKLILEHRLRHGGHPVLRWMAGNVEVVTDPAGNQRPSKANSTERIDGMVALDMALGRAMVHLAEGPSIYEERGILAL